MRILLTVNKTLTNGKDVWLDGATWNLYHPLQNLGHEVYFYDTVNPEEKNFTKIVDRFKPDLIFCCLTNDARIAPFEPWEELIKYTTSGTVKTFNWFCDETWRFESFSKAACHYFTVCSTPEVEYIEKFKTEANYPNIILGMWHSNIDFYPRELQSKEFDVLFCGHLNQGRVRFLEALSATGIDVQHGHGLEYQEMLQALSRAYIGINFSKNYNGDTPVLQIKGRMFEVPAAKTLLLTEYAPGLENYYRLDNEIVTFTTPTEMVEKTQALLQNPSLLAQIASNGHRRFMRDHESHIRLKQVLEEIEKI